jgi:two-component system response regulator HydG
VPGKVLIVDDEPATCELLQAALGRRGFTTAAQLDAASALAQLDREDFDVVITDLNLGGEMNGIELCRRIGDNRPNLPVVVITAHGSMETAVAAIRAGAYDFVTKPFEMAQIALTLERAAQTRALREEVNRLRQAVRESQSPSDLTGSSRAIKHVQDLVARVAETDASVLITGESGTGKELVARAVHERSGRSGRFVAVNCAAMPAQLLESELFGHVKGAFTDARTDRQGLFVQAKGGTLLLDEIGEMPIELQPKLLRVLQERNVRPLGSDREVEVDVRIVAATNRDLETEVREKRFREDLYYRIHVVHVAVPPLREREGDVLVLAQHFVEKYASRSGKHVVGISTAAAEALLGYDWPGNVRELQNVIERAVALTRVDRIAPEDLPAKVQTARPPRIASTPPGGLTVDGGRSGDSRVELVALEEIERRHILKVLDAVGGRRIDAAQILGLDRKTLYRKLAKYRGETEPD